MAVEVVPLLNGFYILQASTILIGSGAERAALSLLQSYRAWRCGLWEIADYSQQTGVFSNSDDSPAMPSVKAGRGPGTGEMSSKSSVSVIIIFLNAERFIEEAIESVFAQTYKDWELLLVDDGSTDSSTRITLGYAKRYPGKVRYLEHPGHQNRGMSASRNLGISHAKGEYIAFLDADDVWLAHKLQQQVEILGSYPKAGMVYGLSQYWHSWTGDPEDIHHDFVPELGVQADTLFKPPTLLVLLYPLGSATAPPPSDLLMRREVVERLGGFEEHFGGMYQVYEDQAFLSKVYLKEPVFVAGECWDRYRQHPAQCISITKRADQYYSARLFFLNWLEDYLHKQRVEGTEIWNLLREQRLIAKVLADVQEREWKQTIWDLLVLLRRHPRVFVRAWRKLRSSLHLHR